VGPTTLQLLFVLFLIVLSALASATETALMTLSPGDIHENLKERRPSRMIAWWHRDPNRLLTAILITNNLINILASSLATSVTQSLLEQTGLNNATSIAVAIAVGVMTLLIVMFGEVVPKTYARNNPKSVVPLFPIIWLFCRLFTLPAAALQRLSGGIITAAGGTVESQHPVTEAQIDSLIRIGAEQGTLTGGKGDLLSSIVEFSETRVMEILVPRPDMVAFDVDEKLDDVLRTVGIKKYSRYPVYEDESEEIIGILTTKDLLDFMAAGDRAAFDMRALARRHKVVIVPETNKIGAVLKEMQHERVQMAFAVDEFGGIAGLVSIEDIVEEIVGEIWDEHEKAEESIKQIRDGVWMVKARAAVEELQEATGMELPEQDIFETVGGLVMAVTGKVPANGEHFEYAGFDFEVRERTRTRVISLAVSRLASPDNEGVSD